MNSRNRNREGAPSRREVLAAGGSLAGALTASGMLNPAPGAAASRRVLHIVGHSHIDAAWLWPWNDGADSVLTTFRSALDRMNETPGFCYSHSSAAHYRWVEQVAPVMFQEVRQRIREKRWEVVGGWVVEPDCNVPSAESFVRQALYGKAYCQRALGVEVDIGFNPDGFGHAAGLPTLLRRAGYRYYVFMRPNPTHSGRTDLPVLFWWEGPDGSRLLTLRIADTYDSPPRRIEPAAKVVFANGFDDGAFFLGIGNHGGGITRDHIRGVLALRAENRAGLPELRWSTLGAYFAAIGKSPAASSLPVIRGELQYVARGCYSAIGELKANNRRAERWLGQAETIAVGAAAGNFAYPRQELADGWWKVLFSQFHDILSGTSIHPVYLDTRDSHGAACDTARRWKVAALQSMAQRVDTRAVPESALFLYNPLPWRRRAWVEFAAEKDPHKAGRSIGHLASRDGVRHPIHWFQPVPLRSASPSFGMMGAVVDLPPCGYKVFEMAYGEAPAAGPAPGKVSPRENGPGLASFRAPDGTELLGGPLGLVVLSDLTDAWGHGPTEFYQSKWREEIGRPSLASTKVIEDGPVMRTVRQVAWWRNSEILLDIVTYSGIDAVELRFLIDWHERGQMLKLEIPTVFQQPQVVARAAGAVSGRPPNGGEEPCQDWVALQGAAGSGQYTLGVLNNSSYSYDCLDGLFRSVLIRAIPFLPFRSSKTVLTPSDESIPYMDQGRQERKFWLVAGKGAWTELALDRRAEEAQTPAEYVVDSAHAGSEPWEKSFFEVSPANVSVLAIKQAESSDGTIVRVQERSGSKIQAVLSGQALRWRQTFALAPFEVKTLLLTGAAGNVAVREVSLMET
jgi:alpha-mannosidase